MEFTNIHYVAALGFGLAVIFGAVANKTNFCTMGAVSDWINIGVKGRLGAWLLAMGIAVGGAQVLELTGLVDLSTSIYRSSAFGWGGYIIGGFLFGIGMTLSGGCGQRTLVRVGTGNLKSLVVFLVMGVSAYMTLRGVLGVVRLELMEPLTMDLSERGIEDQGLATLIANWSGMQAGAGLKWGVGLVVSAVLIVSALRMTGLRGNADNLFGGIAVGAIIVAAWVITGILGADDFDPVPLESLSFVAPTGNTISYLMTYTGATINFGIAAVLGIITGSFLFAIVTRSFKIETFSQREDMINHLFGGVLMGFGGVLALGCTVGQGISGVSTLALGSFIAVSSIILGSAITMRVQYHRMDDLSMPSAWTQGIADILLPWRSLD